MPSRFCPRCGTKALAGAKFCAECGASLSGGRPVSESPWQLTTVGTGVLGFFVVAGLAIWTLILSPAPPRPGPGGPAPRTASAAPAETASSQLPEGHPKVPMELPAEVKTFISDLAAKAKDKPHDVDTWVKLGMVYSRAAQIDPAYDTEALTAFQHVLEIEPQNPDALRGVANVHYDRDESREAVPFFERYLALRPDDPSARTDLATMYLYSGDATKAISTYQDVIRRNPSFMQAHYNLAVTYHRQGDDTAALAELDAARKLATGDDVRKQIDEMVTALKNGTADRPEVASAGGTATAPPAASSPRSPFQGAVEEAFRTHPIMGPRIVRFEWTAPAAGRVLMQNFPMDAMPPAVREKFAAHLGQQIGEAQTKFGVEGPVRMDIADASSGTVMATVTP